MLAGLLLGVWIRWWTVPIVALGWAVVIAFGHPPSALGGGLFGAVNGAVGVLVALGLRSAFEFSMRPRGHCPGRRRSRPADADTGAGPRARSA
jgi:hypothetical protein